MTNKELEEKASEYRKESVDVLILIYDIDKAYLAGAEPREKRIAELEAQIEKMKKYIKACWVEENLNDYSSYNTNCSDEFRDLVKELNEELEKATGKELIEERDYCGCLRNY